MHVINNKPGEWKFICDKNKIKVTQWPNNQIQTTSTEMAISTRESYMVKPLHS